MTDSLAPTVIPAAEGAPPLCRWCGITVKRPDPADVGTTRVWDSHRNPGFLARGLPAAFVEVQTALCDEHAALWQRAQALAERYPDEIRRRHGNVGAERIAAALIGLEIAMWAPLRAFASSSITSSADELLAFVDALAPIGGKAAWSSSDATGPSRMRWSHVPRDVRQDARFAYREYVLRSAEVPEPFGPPEGGARGCVYCGRGTVLVKPSDALRAWGREVTVEANAITPGTSYAGTIHGHLCPGCQKAVGFDGIGLRTIERAVLAHLGWELRSGYKLDRPPLYAWAALGKDYAPNAEPWQHLDLSSILAGLPEMRRRGTARRIGEDWPGAGIVGYLDLTGAVDERRR